MSTTDAFKLLEVGVLLVAGVAFVWWQLRDVAKAQQASRPAQQDPESAAAKPLNPLPSSVPKVKHSSHTGTDTSRQTDT